MVKKITNQVICEIVRLSTEGHSSRKIAERLGISKDTVLKYQKLESLEVAENVGGRPKLIKDIDWRACARGIKAGEMVTVRDL